MKSVSIAKEFKLLTRCENHTKNIYFWEYSFHTDNFGCIKIYHSILWLNIGIPFLNSFINYTQYETQT